MALERPHKFCPRLEPQANAQCNTEDLTYATPFFESHFTSIDGEILPLDLYIWGNQNLRTTQEKKNPPSESVWKETIKLENTSLTVFALRSHTLADTNQFFFFLLSWQDFKQIVLSDHMLFPENTTTRKRLSLCM